MKRVDNPHAKSVQTPIACEYIDRASTAVLQRPW
jgi:hypothetical protein